MPTITIATCTRNPDAARLERVLAAVAALRVPGGWEREVIVVDSASTPALAPIAGARVLREEEPGLARARRRAIAESRGELIVWVDDDNVLLGDYLDETVRLAAAHPLVTVFGAGTITVEFTGPVSPWAERTLRPFFQERAHGRDEFGRSTDWAAFFPVGSGLVTRRAAAVRWAERSASGAWTLTGRSGAALSAGDDAQIIFGAVAAGESVGVGASLRLVHLIPPSRTEPGYLARMEFGISASLRIARAECFPDDASVRADDVSMTDAARAALRAFRSAPAGDGAHQARSELARRLGALAGSLHVRGRPEPVWLRAAVATLGLR